MYYYLDKERHTRYGGWSAALYVSRYVKNNEIDFFLQIMTRQLSITELQKADAKRITKMRQNQRYPGEVAY